MRPGDWQAQRAPLPLRWIYPFGGILLALAATVGLLLVRSREAHHTLDPAWALAELRHERWVYTYVGAVLVGLIGTVGVVLGRREERLWRGCHTDALTGVASRRYVAARLDEELRLARRRRTRLALLLVDVDNLKRINDESGHQAGDAALQAVGRALETSCRSSDVVGRLGGDEFVVVAPGSSAGEALQVAERVRATLERSSRRGESVAVSVSIGVVDATRLPNPRSDSLLSAADRALYAAKHAGRDRVVVAGVERQAGSSASSPTVAAVREPSWPNAI